MTNPELTEDVEALKKRIHELEQLESKHAILETALLESETKYRALVENSLAGVYIYQDGLVRYANERWCDICGYRPEEVIDRLNPEHITHPDDMHIIKRNIDRCIAGKSDSYRFTHRFIKKDGREIMVIVHGSVMMHNGRQALSGTLLDISDLVRAATTIRKTEIKYRSIFENAIEGIFQTTPGGKHLSVNPALAKMFGFDSPKEMMETITNIGQQNYVHPEDRERLKQLIEEQGAVEGFETRNYRKDGCIFWLSIKAHAVRNTEGHVLYYEGSAEDISERKRVEEDLRTAHQRLFDIVEFLPDATFVIDEKKRVVAWNRACEEMTGVRKKDIIGKGDHAYAVPFFGKPHPMIVDRVLENNNSNACLFGESYVPMAYSGKGAYLSSKASLFFDSGGNVVGAIESIRDITEQRRIEEELRESEERYRTVIENSNDGIVIVKDSKHFYVNKKFLDTFGFDRPEQVIGQPVGIVTHPDDRERTSDFDRRRQQSENVPQQYEFKGIKTNGDILFLEASAARTIYKGDPITLVYMRDVTAKKHLEAQFLQAQKMEAIGTLAGGIAHDFNNILTALVGYGSLLRVKLDEDNPLRAYADHILSSAEKATQLVQGLLTFSRKQPITLKPVQINNILKETEKLLKRLLTEDVILETSLTYEDTTVLGDETQINQILFNLVTNARDAMPNGGILNITTKLAKIDRKFRKTHGYGEFGTYVQISVSDNGTGMDEKTQKQIFDPFFTTKEVGKGTGLGLATTYGIVKQHNGYINVHSEINTGTSIHIFLPVAKATIQEEKPISSEIKRGHERILVAEDNDTVRGFIRGLLVDYGYSVIEAIDGKDALEKFRTDGKIDLIIIDSVMPNMNGREVYDEICKTQHQIKTLFMSGYTKDIVLGKGVEEKNFHFISKPLSPDKLLKKIREILDDTDIIAAHNN